MSKDKSILDQIMTSQKVSQASQFNPGEIVNDLLQKLSSREREILNLRYSLNGQKKQTLEEIGKSLGVTRERVRQIEAGAIKKLRGFPDEDCKGLKDAESLITKTLESHGGIMEEGYLVDTLLSCSGSSDSGRAALLFIVSELMRDQFNKVKADSFFRPAWKYAFASTDLAKSYVTELVKFISGRDEPLEEDALLADFRAAKFCQSQPENAQIEDDVLVSMLELACELKKNPFGEWGLATWSTISPRRMNDKIYLVLKKTGDPLHFTEIAELINKTKFDRKTAYPATVHNELILDDKYVLVGRGIYALKDWGYRPGVVADVVREVLASADGSMTREQIVEAVLKQRMVCKTTIHLALMNKDRFKKLGSGKYELVRGDEQGAPEGSEPQVIEA